MDRPPLIPEFRVDELVRPIPEDPQPVTWAVSWEWDFGTGDFVLDGTGRVVEIDPVSAWVQDCMAILKTQRGVYRAVPWDVGIDLDAARRMQPAVRGPYLMREIRDAIGPKADKRTLDIVDMAVRYEEDRLYADFTPIPNGYGGEFPMSVAMTRLVPAEMEPFV